MTRTLTTRPLACPSGRTYGSGELQETYESRILDGAQQAVHCHGALLRNGSAVKQSRKPICVAAQLPYIGIPVTSFEKGYLRRERDEEVWYGQSICPCER